MIARIYCWYKAGLYFMSIRDIVIRCMKGLKGFPSQQFNSNVLFFFMLAHLVVHPIYGETYVSIYNSIICKYCREVHVPISFYLYSYIYMYMLYYFNQLVTKLCETSTVHINAHSNIVLKQKKNPIQIHGLQTGIFNTFSRIRTVICVSKVKSICCICTAS